MAVSSIDNLRFDGLRGKHLLVALSGGADSVALMHILLRRMGEDGFFLTCAHFHHGIRGADADADAAFCQTICDKAGIRLICGFADIPAIARERQTGIETAARIERYRFLNEAKAECGADLIALAHHADDQAETVLMHLLRGAGPEGISAMPMLSGDKFRPLIGISKQSLVDFLVSEGISWREDATNAVSDTPRNALRLNVLPEIEKSYPSAKQAIARYARAAAIENNLIDRLTDEFIKKRLKKLPCGEMIRLDNHWEEAVLRRTIRRLCGSRLEAAKPDFQEKLTEAQAKLDELILLAQKIRGKIQVFSDLTVEKTPSGLYFLRDGIQKPEPMPVQVPMDISFGNYCRIVIEESDSGISADDPFTETVDPDALRGAVIRLREDGDRIRPLGAEGSRLLSDYLTDKKVDRPIRNCLPVIAKEKNILWVGGYGISDDIRIIPSTTHCVRIKIYINTDEKAEEKI